MLHLDELEDQLRALLVIEVILPHSQCDLVLRVVENLQQVIEVLNESLLKSGGRGMTKDRYQRGYPCLFGEA